MYMCTIINWYNHGLSLHEFKKFGYDDHSDAIKMHFLLNLCLLQNLVIFLSQIKKKNLFQKSD
jgi:hypothetical protein